MRIKSHRVCGFTDMVNFRVFFEVMAEPRRAWMKLTPDSDSVTSKTYSTHSETPRSETFFSFVWLCYLFIFISNVCVPFLRLSFDITNHDIIYKLISD